MNVICKSYNTNSFFMGRLAYRMYDTAGLITSYYEYGRDMYANTPDFPVKCNIM